MTAIHFGKTLTHACAIVALASCTHAQMESQTASHRVDWPIYGGNADGDRYSELAQINRQNVALLQEVWRFDTGEGGLQTSPLVVDGILYGTTPDQKVFALDAASGRRIWEHVPIDKAQQPVRGLTYWAEGLQRRLFSSSGTHLFALDPATGALDPSFGEGGRIDLRKDLGRDFRTISAFLTTPGVIFQDLIIVGFRTSENAPAAPGAVRAYDVRTGKLRWTFNMVPRPGEVGHETWPAKAWETAGGANAWAGMVVDDQRGIVFVPSGSAVDDFYGADRLGDNLFANSLVALDARTGKRLWHFQAVHHDVLDRDLPSPPVLLTVTQGGRRIDAVAQPTKQGFLFVFDRVTGKSLFPIEERPVPQSDVPGEKLSPTQPFALKPLPYARQQLTASMLTNRTPEAQAEALKAFRSFRSEGPFTPLTLKRPSVVFPGFDGGAEWGGPAVDRHRGIIYINSNDIAYTGGLATLKEMASRGGQLYQQHCSACHGLKLEGAPPDMPRLTDARGRIDPMQAFAIIQKGRGRMPGFPHLGDMDIGQILRFMYSGGATANEGAAPAQREASSVGAPRNAHPYGFTGYQKFLDAEGYPAVAPPWGTLNAIDLNSGEYLWKVPLGEYPELVAKGMSGTGSENYGGPIVTAGGLVIIGATLYDQKLRAFDSSNGKLLWETVLPFSGMATPITYRVGGRQYIVIATSNSRNPKGPPGSAYVAFALPQRR